MATDWRVRVADHTELDLVEPLWVAVHHRHAEAMPELAPYVSDAQTWAVRRGLYSELLAKPDTLLLIAFVGDTAVGYGLAHIMAVDETWIPDTWETGSRIGEIESLSVLPTIPWQRPRLRTSGPARATSERTRRRRCDPRRTAG